MERAREIKRGQELPRNVTASPTTRVIPIRRTSSEENLVPVKFDPHASAGTEHFHEQDDVKQTQNVTIHQVKIIKKKKNKNASTPGGVRNTPKAIEPPRNMVPRTIPLISEPYQTLPIRRVNVRSPTSPISGIQATAPFERSVPVQNANSTRPIQRMDVRSPTLMATQKTPGTPSPVPPTKPFERSVPIQRTSGTLPVRRVNVTPPPSPIREIKVTERFGNSLPVVKTAGTISPSPVTGPFERSVPIQKASGTVPVRRVNVTPPPSPIREIKVTERFGNSLPVVKTTGTPSPIPLTGSFERSVPIQNTTGAWPFRNMNIRPPTSSIREIQVTEPFGTSLSAQKTIGTPTPVSVTNPMKRSVPIQQRAGTWPFRQMNIQAPTSSIRDIHETFKNSFPPQKIFGTGAPTGLKSSVIQRANLKDDEGERCIPVTVERKPESNFAPSARALNAGENLVPVKYQPDARVENERFLDRKYTERQTLTIDRVQHVKTSKKKSIPMQLNVDVRPKLLSEAEISVHKRPASPPRQRNAITYRNEMKPIQIANFGRTLQRRASDSIITKSEIRSANTQTLSRSFSSLPRRSYSPQPRAVAREPRDTPSPAPSYPRVEVATVRERHVMSVSPVPLQIPVHVDRPSSASSESTLEPSSPVAEYATLRVFGAQSETHSTSRSSQMHAVTRYTKSTSSSQTVMSDINPMSRETQTSPSFATTKFANNAHMQTKSKPPALLHATVISRSARSISPTSSIASDATSELLRESAFPLSPPDSSIESWSSIPVPSLSPVTSQCDTDCLVIADANTGVIPDALSDAETDELIGADPFARHMNEMNLHRTRSNESEMRTPPELKVNDVSFYTAGRSISKKPREVATIVPPPRDESATEHNVFNTSQETVVLNQEFKRSQTESASFTQDLQTTRRTQEAYLPVENRCAKNYMSVYSVFIYPPNN